VKAGRSVSQLPDVSGLRSLLPFETREIAANARCYRRAVRKRECSSSSSSSSSSFFFFFFFSFFFFLLLRRTQRTIGDVGSGSPECRLNGRADRRRADRSISIVARALR